MTFHATPLAGVFTIEPERRHDERGHFVRLFCEKEFAAAGLRLRPTQVASSVSARRGTLRGLHYQAAPAAQAKLVRCARGAVWDVALDLRRGSASFGRAFGVRLCARSGTMLYVPPGCAHGFLSLTDDVETAYVIGGRHSPEHERGVRWDDPGFALDWPFAPVVVSERDLGWPDHAGNDR